MPSIKDESTVKEIARVFCGEGKRNKAQTMLTVGYSKAYANCGLGQDSVYKNIQVKAAISAIDDESQAKTGWNVEQAVKAIDDRIEYLEKIAAKGNTTAVQVITGLLKEKNDITGLHIKKVLDLTEPTKDLTESDADEARAFLKWRNTKGLEKGIA